MKRNIVLLVFCLLAPVATLQAAEVGIHNQIIEGSAVSAPTDTVINVDRVHMSQAGNLVVQAENAYGNPSAAAPLGQIHLTRGVHENVKIHLNPRRLQDSGYLVPGHGKTAFVTVQANGDKSPASPGAGQAFRLRTAEPVQG